MAGAEALEREAEAAQHLPAALGMHRVPEVVGHPLCNLGATPDAAIWGGTFKERGKLGLQGRTEQRGAAGVGMAPVAERRWTTIVVAVGEGTDPGQRVASGGSDLCRRCGLGKEPDDLPVTAGDGIGRLSIPHMQFVHRKMGGQS